MEAINNLANVATKAIWGENNTNAATTSTTTDQDKHVVESTSSKQEPISGIQGDTTKGEPFDAGNMETVDVANKPEVIAANKEDAASKLEADVSHKADAGTLETTGVNATDKADTTSASKTTEHNPVALDKPSSHMKDDSTKVQSDVRDPADTAEPHKEEEKNDVDNVEPMNPDKLKGDGPKPLEQVARERGGDAGSTPTESKSDSPDPADGGAAIKDADEKKKTSNLNEDGEPLGTKHVSSTGVAADGGDFDAANPGAGAEADKILAEKGIHVDKPGDKKELPDRTAAASPSDNTTGGSPDRKGIRGLGHKIKDKLRRSSQS